MRLNIVHRVLYEFIKYVERLEPIPLWHWVFCIIFVRTFLRYQLRQQHADAAETIRRLRNLVQNARAGV
jgi:hypothetical protein